MDVTPVDPRDQRWERMPRAYRVVFWRRQPPPPGRPAEAMGYESVEYELTGGHVDEVLAWASARCEPEWVFTLGAVLVDAEGQLGLVSLLGDEPTAAR